MEKMTEESTLMGRNCPQAQELTVSRSILERKLQKSVWSLEDLRRLLKLVHQDLDLTLQNCKQSFKIKEVSHSVMKSRDLIILEKEIFLLQTSIVLMCDL